VTQVNLGNMYYKGFGVDKDLNAAALWWEHACPFSLLADPQAVLAQYASVSQTRLATVA